MNRPRNEKLNELLLEWPCGTLLTASYLKKKGYYKQLIKLYVDSGWIRVIGRGVYVRLNEQITWQAAVNTLQSQLNLPIHVGGLTALSLYGIQQYVEANNTPSFYLYNTTTENIHFPKWFRDFFKGCHLEHKKLFDKRVGLIEKDYQSFSIYISSPERAILELIALVPDKISLSHANEIMEGLHRLRAPLVQKLLEACLSIKTKRLFLFLSELNNLPFFEELDLKRIDLGKGKRVIDKGGRYSAKWEISLPNLNDEEVEDT